MKYELLMTRDIEGNPCGINEYGEYTGVPKRCPNCSARQTVDPDSIGGRLHICPVCKMEMNLEGPISALHARRVIARAKPIWHVAGTGKH